MGPLTQASILALMFTLIPVFIKIYFQYKQCQEVKNWENCRKLRTDVFSLFQNKRFADVTLRCGTEEFEGHRNILSARSRVFQKMFETKSKLKPENIVDLTPMEPRSFKALMEYLYSGEIYPLTAELAFDLILVSEEHEILELKQTCFDYLYLNINPKNALTIFRLSSTSAKNMEEIKRHALQYICSKFKELEKCPGWDSFKKYHPSLALEIMDAKLKYIKNIK